MILRPPRRPPSPCGDWHGHGIQGYDFREGMPGPVVGLNIENDGWSFGPIDVFCSAISEWQANIVGAMNRSESGYQLPPTVRAQPCNTQGRT